MATQVVEYSHFTITATKGTDVDGATLGTVGGAIIDVDIEKVNESSTQIEYQVVVLHTATGTNNLEYSIRSFTKTLGTDAQDVSFRTNEGAAMGQNITPISNFGNNIKNQILIVHLDA